MTTSKIRTVLTNISLIVIVFLSLLYFDKNIFSFLYNRKVSTRNQTEESYQTERFKNLIIPEYKFPKEFDPPTLKNCQELSWNDFVDKIIDPLTVYKNVTGDSRKVEADGIKFGPKIWDVDPVFTVILNELIEQRNRMFHEKSNINILEIGAFMGRASIKMIQICNNMLKRYNKKCNLISIDLFFSSNGRDLYQIYRENVKSNKLENFISPLKMKASEGVHLIKCHQLHPDIIYLDADHSGSEVLFELANLFPLLKNDGIIFGDDFSMPAYDGLRDAIIEFCRTQGLPLQLLGQSPANRNFIIRKNQIGTYEKSYVTRYPIRRTVGWKSPWKV